MSSIGDTTVSMLLRLVISMPRPPKLPLRVDLELLVQVGGEVCAVRIERGEHAVDGALDQLLGRDLVDVVLLDDRQDVGEGLEVSRRTPWRPPRPDRPCDRRTTTAAVKSTTKIRVRRLACRVFIYGRLPSSSSRRIIAEGRMHPQMSSFQRCSFAPRPRGCAGTTSCNQALRWS